MRAALNELATKEPEWLKGVVPPAWYENYSKRIENSRLPRSDKERMRYAQTVGEDGFMLLTLIDTPNAPAILNKLANVVTLRTAWARHYERNTPLTGEKPSVRFKTNKAVTQAKEKLESPYDPDARYRSKSGRHWTGYRVHISETCDDDNVHLITRVQTTAADVHEAMSTEAIHQSLAKKKACCRLSISLMLRH